MVTDNEALRPLASLTTALETATGLHARGLWPIPVYPRGARIKTDDGEKEATGKEPMWSGWGKERRTVPWWEEVIRKTPDVNIGMCLGPGRGPEGRWLADIEGDGPEAEDSRLTLFGGEVVETLGWSSSRGDHEAWLIDGDRLAPILAKLKGCEGSGLNSGVYKLPNLPGLEFRFGGYKGDGSVKQVQSVVPPSPGTDGIPRAWNGVETIAEAPDAFYLTLEMSAGYAEELNVERNTAEPEKRNPWIMTATSGGGLDAYGRVCLEGECSIIAASVEGSRNRQLNLSAFKIGRLVGAEAIGEQAAVAAMTAAGRQCGLPDGEIARTIRGAMAAGMKYPRDLSHVGQDPAKGGKSSGSNTRTKGPGESGSAEDLAHERNGFRLDVVRVLDVKARPVLYLSEPHLPRAMVVLLAGLGGEGKSFLILDALARLSRGLPCFGAATASYGPIHSLVMACEDGKEDTLKPRLIAAGADMERIEIVQGLVNAKGERRPFDIGYLPYLRDYIVEGRAQGKDFRVVSIDPITTYVGRAKVDDHRDAELKPALEGLSDIAQDLDITFICSAHLNKGSGKSAMYRVMGGAAYVTTSRLCYVYGRDHEDESRRVLATLKCNIPDRPPSLTVSSEVIPREQALALLAPHVEHLSDDHRERLARQLRRLIYEGESQATADDVLGGNAGPGRRPETDHIAAATDWLKDRLAEGPAGAAEVAMQGDLRLGRLWPDKGMDPERRKVQVKIRIKWWRETILKGKLGGSSRKHGMGGIWFFTLPGHAWPPEAQALRDATEAQKEEGDSEDADEGWTMAATSWSSTN
jgi:hypothetical protein